MSSYDIFHGMFAGLEKENKYLQPEECLASITQPDGSYSVTSCITIHTVSKRQNFQTDSWQGDWRNTHC